MGVGNVELIFDRVGHFGRFQMLLYLVCAYQFIFCGVYYLASNFMLVIPEHTCKPPGNVKQAIFHNFSTWGLEDMLSVLNLDQKDYITVELQNGEIWELSRCSRMWRENTTCLDYEYSGSKHHVPCFDGYVYDQSKWGSSVVRHWDLVCDQEWYAKMIQPLLMFGLLVGAVIFGYISDRLGRRLALGLSSTGILFFGLASVIMFDYFGFMASCFFLAMVTSGYLLVAFVYVMEFIGKKFRTWAPIHLHTFFVFGTILMALMGHMDHPILTTVVILVIKFGIGSAFSLLYLYTSELYPTVVRCLAMGFSSMTCHLASIMVSFDEYFTSIWIFLPQVFFGVMAFLSGLATLKLPETLETSLTTTWEEETKQRVQEGKSSSNKLFPTINELELEKVEVAHL